MNNHKPRSFSGSDRLANFMYIFNKWMQRRYFFFATIPGLIGATMMMLSDSYSANAGLLIGITSGMLIAQYIIVRKMNKLQEFV